MAIEIDLGELAEQVSDVSEAAGMAWRLSTALMGAGDDRGADLWGTVAVNLEALSEAYGDCLTHHSGTAQKETPEA